jgi:carbamoyl-phosphate synthase large subunit
VDVVLPQTTREIGYLVGVRQQLADQGIPLAAPEQHAVDVGNNKLLLLEAMSQVPSLQPFVPAFQLTTTRDQLAAAAAAFGYPQRPVVVKPCVSNGMRGFRILKDDAWDLARFLAEKPSGSEIGLDELLKICRTGQKWPELLVMEHLGGAEYSVDAFVDTRLRIAVPRLRRVIRSGISFENSIELRSDLIEATLGTADHLGLTSAFGLQFKLDEHDRPKVLECNPRVQGTMVASYFAGVNILWLAVCDALGRDAGGPPPELKPAEFIRYWGGVGVTGEQTRVI